MDHKKREKSRIQAMDMKSLRSTKGKTTLSRIKMKFCVVGAQNLLEEKQLKRFGIG
jgi:hypothetical protein